MTPVNVALGELVRREVGRRALRSANDAGGIQVALADAREVADELTSLIARLERAGPMMCRSVTTKPRLGTSSTIARTICVEGWGIGFGRLAGTE